MIRCTRRLITCLLMSVQIGCNARDQPSTPVDSGQAVAPTAPTPPSRNPKIPTEVSYPIIRDEEEGNASWKKRMVDVRLNMRVSPEVLRAIALEVKSQETSQYMRTFIWVYLPEQVPGIENAPWATCHFDPALEVCINGLTQEAEVALRRRDLDVPGTRIGAWLIDLQFGGHVSVLYEEDNRVKLAELFAGGGRLVSDMIELPSEADRRFKRANASEIHAIDDSGTLRTYNSENKVIVGALPLK